VIAIRQEAQIDQLEWFYEEAIARNGAAEPAESKAIFTRPAICRAGAGKIAGCSRILFVI
jgi:hypothetical protein